MISNKANLRREILTHRDALPAASVEKLGEVFAARLLSLPLWQAARCPALYMSFGGEASTRRILEACFLAKRHVALPRVEEAELRLHLVTSFDDLVPGKFGILEPRAEAPRVEPGEPDLFVVPGVAFDRRGHRVGYGKGYYDRLLELTGAPTLALAYGFQIVHRIPEEPHDRRMSFILTPDELVDCRG